MCFSLFSTPALALHNNFLASAFYQYLLPTICIFIGNTHRTHTHTAHTSHKSENNKRLLVPSFFFSFFVPHFRYPLAIILFLLAPLIPSLASLLLHNFICLACFIVSVACASHFNATESRPAAFSTWSLDRTTNTTVCHELQRVSDLPAQSIFATCLWLRRTLATVTTTT